MNIKQTEQYSLHISRDKLLALVGAMIGGSKGREDDEHPLPPGPWDPVIRFGLERISIFGPHPEPWRVFGNPVPWRSSSLFFDPSQEHWKFVFESILAKHPEIFDVIGGGHSFGTESILKPQPLALRFTFLGAVAHAVISRAELLQEFADATQRESEQRGIIIVSGYTRRFSDDWCGNGFKLKWPFPHPRPDWFTHELDGIDLLVMATQFDQASKEIFSPDLRQNLADTCAKFVQAGLSRMQ